MKKLLSLSALALMLCYNVANAYSPNVQAAYNHYGINAPTTRGLGISYRTSDAEIDGGLARTYLTANKGPVVGVSHALRDNATGFTYQAFDWRFNSVAEIQEFAAGLGANMARIGSAPEYYFYATLLAPSIESLRGNTTLLVSDFEGMPYPLDFAMSAVPNTTEPLFYTYSSGAKITWTNTWANTLQYYSVLCMKNMSNSSNWSDDYVLMALSGWLVTTIPSTTPYTIAYTSPINTMRGFYAPIVGVSNGVTKYVRTNLNPVMQWQPIDFYASPDFGIRYGAILEWSKGNGW